MSKTVLWTLGLLGLALLTFLCFSMNRPDIEADLTGGTSAALAAAGLTGADAALSGRDVTLTGTVPTEADRERAEAEAYGVRGVRHVDNQLLVAGGAAAAAPDAPTPDAPDAPASAFTVTDGPDGIVVRGTVPSEEVRAAVMERAAAAFPGREVTDALEVVDGAEADWEPSMMALLPEIGDVSGPSVTADAGEIVLRGTVESDEVKERVEAAAEAAVEAPYTFRSELTVLSAAGADQVEGSGSTDADVQAAEAALREALSIGSVEFATGTNTLTPRSREILDRAAAVFVQYRGVGAEVQGHTDSQGSDASNQALSDRRATAVREYLLGKDVEDGQLTARGYGEAEPIADNDTSEGRARNRRVVFALRAL